MKLGSAATIAVLLVLAAVGGGLAASVLARRPAPTPRIVTFTPAPTVVVTPAPVDPTSLFRQRLSGGCATAENVWIVTDGGTLLRYDGTAWERADPTLRSLVRAACDDREMLAVGPAGAVLLVDEDAKEVRSIFLGVDDYSGVSLMPAGGLVSGGHGAVQLLANGTWQPFAAGIDEDLLAIVGLALDSAWAVGAGGASYRLEPAGWREVPTGVDVTLRALAATSATDVVAAGDAGTVLRFDGRAWHAVESGVDVTLRDAVLAPGPWIVGDAGVVLAGDPLRRVDLGTTCDLHAVFTRGADVWIVGSTGSRGAVWRLRDGRVAQTWGSC